MSKKRIALIGNVNNNVFALTRHLRDLGYEAHLFHRPENDHFQPKADTYSLDTLKDCHTVSWLNKGFHKVDISEVKRQLGGFGFYIGQSDEAAVAYKAGFHLDVYYPFGSDVYKYAQLPTEYAFVSKAFALLKRNRFTLLKYMREGTPAKYLKGAIVNARYILAEYRSGGYEDKMNALPYKGKYEHVGMPFFYDKEYKQIINGRQVDVHWKQAIDEVRANNDFVLLYHGRQEWKTYLNDFTGKNTHHVIIGFANYVKKHAGTRACLCMLEYGSDIENSKKLIAELGIEKHVRWFPKMYRKDIMYLIHNVDVCCGEFMLGDLAFGTIVEAMQMQKPIIHNRADHLYTSFYKELYPMLQALTPEEVEQQITFAAAHPDAVRQIGVDASVWIQKHFIEKPLKHLVDIIEDKR